MVDTGAMSRQSGTGRSTRRLVGAALVVVSGLLVAGCFNSDYHYVKDSGDGAYFKVPKAWHFFDDDAVAKELDSSLSPAAQQAQRDASWRVAFDASTKPSLKHLTSGKAVTQPFGLAVVEKLGSSSADSLSLSSLRNAYFNVDDALQNNAAQIVTYDMIQRDGGFHGIHMVVDVTQGSSTMRIDQTSLIDQPTTKTYSLVVICESKCFASNQSKIDQVVHSWTVKAK
jgi:hypothetical protein